MESTPLILRIFRFFSSAGLWSRRYTIIRFNNDELVHQSRPDIDLQINGRAAMQALGMFEKMTSDYDLLFFLPYDGKTLLEKGKSYDTVIDKKLPEVVEGYFRNLHPLEGTDKAKVKRATDIIKAYIAWKAEVATSDEQQAVRGSG